MSVLLAKPPSPVEVYNDRDGDLVHFWRVVRDPEQFERLVLRLSLTPYSRAEWQWSRDTYAAVQDPVERAARWYVAVRMSFSAHAHAWSYSVTHSVRGMSSAISKYLSAIEYLPAVHARLKRVQIECGDWREVVDRYDNQQTLFYLDPPYVPETRRSGEYRYEMSIADHEALVERLLALRGAAVLSGYMHPVYRPLEQAGWRRITRTVPCSAVGRTRLTGVIGKSSTDERHWRQECLWIGPPSRVPELWTDAGDSCASQPNHERAASN